MQMKKSVRWFIGMLFTAVLSLAFTGCANTGGQTSGIAPPQTTTTAKNTTEKFPTCSSVKGYAYLDQNTTGQMYSAGMGMPSFSAHALIFNGLQMTNCFKLVDQGAAATAGSLPWKIIVSVSPPSVEREDKGGWVNTVADDPLVGALFGVKPIYDASVQVVLTIVDPKTGVPVQLIQRGENTKFGPVAKSLATAGGIAESVSTKSIELQAIADGVVSAFVAMVSEVEKTSSPSSSISKTASER